MIRFLHTSDWQLGMTRHFLTEGAQERFSQARFDAIRTMGRVAKDENCQFMIVSGDAFESNQVDRKTTARAFEAFIEALLVHKFEFRSNVRFADNNPLKITCH
jgi:DNA repair exonuclease SbcCD nuclease subunit